MSKTINCKKIHYSKQIQNKRDEIWKNKIMPQIIKRYGGLPANAYSNFKTGFKEGFMKECKQKNNKLKSFKSRLYSKRKTRKYMK
jgi:hypothetical protein